MMPPDNTVDFDLHLERTMQDLDELRGDMAADVFILYLKADMTKKGKNDITVQTIKKDLENARYTV